MTHRTCGMAGCSKPHLAKGLCSTHYNHEHQPNRHPELTITCATCGCAHVTQRPNGRFCSLLCRDLWRVDQPDDSMYRARPRGPGAQRVCPLPPDHPVMWVNATCPVSFGPCGWCGAPTCRGDSGLRAYCSPRCKAKAKRVRRRGREAQDYGYWSWSDFMRIAARFSYRCAYCGTKPLDPLDPDHVVPVSRGGTNTTANLLPACRLCNSDKRDLLLSEWADDRAARGKPSRRTSWAPEDRRYQHLTSYQP